MKKWKRIILWSFAGFLGLSAGLVLVALLSVKHSPSAWRAILARVESYASESIGSEIAIRDFKLSLFPLKVQLDGILTRGGGPQTGPLLEIDRVTAEIKLDSLFKREWHFESLTVHHPVLHVAVGPNGQSNLPRPQAKGGGGIETIFDLAIRKFQLDDGEIYFNDMKKPLDAEIYNLQLKAELDRALNSYHGVLSYGQGKVRYGEYAPLAHDLDANFIVTPSRLTLEKLAVVAGQSRIVARGALENFNSPAVQAVYEAQLSSSDLTAVLNNASLPAGVVQMSGELNYQSRGESSFLKNAVLTGDLSSPVLHVKTQGIRAEVRDLSASYKLAGGNIEIQNIRAHALGGSFNATLTIRDFAATSHARLQAHARGVSLDLIEDATQHHPLPEARLSGQISADTDATWGRTLDDLVAHIDATLAGALGENPSAPLSGAVHAGYAAANHEVELRQSYVRTAATSLTLDGKVSRYSQLHLVAHSNNLHEVELLAANLRTAVSGGPPLKLDLYGTASFTGSITGVVTEPRLQGRLEAGNLRVKGSSWKLLRGDVDAGPSGLRLNGGHLEAASKGQINFSLRAGLDKWAFTPASPIDVAVFASQISVADVARLANRAYPISGILSGNLQLRGSQLSPVGRGEINLTGGKILSQPVQILTLKFQGDGTAVHAGLLAHLPAGTAQGQITLNPKTQGYQAQVQADNISLERLQAVKERNLPIVGALSFDASGQGTVSSPQLTATVKISQLKIQEQPIHGLTLAASIHDRLAEITLNSEFAQTPLKGHGTVEMKPPYIADLHLDTPRFSFQPLLALYAPAYEHEVHGETELHASLRGPLKNRTLLEGHADIPVLTASYQQIQLGAAKPVRLDYRSGVLRLQPVSLEGTGTHLQLQAAVPVNDPARATYVVEGSVDLSLARMLGPDLTGGGQIQVDLDSRRQVAGSDSVGEVRIVNASLHSADVPLGLDKGNGVLTISHTRLQVKSLQGQVGGGTVRARGEVTLRPAIRFDLGLNASEVRLRYPEGVRSVLDSDLTLAGNRQEATLAGTVRVERLSLTRDFDITRFISQFSEEQYSPPPAGFAQHVRLDVALQSASQMEAASSQVSLRGNANLRLVGIAAEPVILGRANLNGGDLFLAGNRYVLQSGAIDFVNPLHTEAVVNAQVKTKIDQYDITLILQGPMDRLKTTYTSEPPLPPADIISLLAFGHTAETAAGGTPAGLTSLGPQSALVQGLGSAVSSRVQKFAGLSYFSIDPTLGGSNQNAGARVVIQERVTSNLVVTYSTDVTSTQRQAIQLEYQFNPRWSLSGVRDQNGGFGATASYHKIF